MKIVVVKSPRLLTGLFRVIFKIKKETPETESFFSKESMKKPQGAVILLQPSAVFCGSGRCIFSRRASYGETGSEITYWEEHNDDAGI